VRQPCRPIWAQSQSTRDTNDVFNSNPLRPLERTTSSDGSSITISKIAVIVVADERLFRLGLARLLGEDGDLDVVAVSDGEPDLLGLCTAMSADVVLIDLELSRVDGIDIVQLLASQCPSIKTLILTSNPDWRVRPALIAGAAGILLKDTSPEAIRAAVHSIHLGDQVLCKEAAQWVLHQDRSSDLTPRESAVLRMVARGASNAEIAEQLQLGQKTVRNYVSRLYSKLDLHNRAQIATYLHHRTDIARSGSRTDLATPESSVSNK
jgi:two-component system, NarL family, response regulator LiaR